MQKSSPDQIDPELICLLSSTNYVLITRMDLARSSTGRFHFRNSTKCGFQVNER